MPDSPGSGSKIPRILIVDDELHICNNCIKILSRLECETEYVLNGYDALARIEEQSFDILLTDLKMSRLGGMEVLRQVKEKYPDIIVLIMTGYASVSSAVEVMKLGAFDYLPKPFTPEELRALVIQALEELELRRQNRAWQQKKSTSIITHQLVGDSSKIKKVIEMIKKVAYTDSTVLIHGESGTGKELVARAIHVNSNRSDKVFFAVDCGTLSGNLLESELFGHVKGAFTGAHKDKPGIFKMADKGTVFLDEISNISMDVQAKLLRFLELREFIPLGGTFSEKVDIRMIFATNQDLKTLVEKGEFRQDFYYRIFVYPIIIPPLRQRTSDIPLIAYYFLKQFAIQFGKNIKSFQDSALKKLIDYDWPGNVRQLRNIVERAVILCEQDEISEKDLPFWEDSGQLAQNVPQNNEELKKMKQEIRQKAVNKVEKSFVLNALMKNNWNITRAAENTQMQRTNFQALIKKHHIKIPRESD